MVLENDYIAKSEYEFKVNFNISSSKTHTKGTVMRKLNTTSKFYYTNIRKQDNPIEAFFVENNPDLFLKLEIVATKLLDDIRFNIRKVRRGACDFNVLHQNGHDLYMRQGTKSPFSVGRKSLIEQFTVIEFHDRSTDTTYTNNSRVGTPHGMSRVDYFNFNGDALCSRQRYPFDSIKFLKKDFSAHDKLVHYPNVGYIINKVTGVQTEIRFDELENVNKITHLIFALKENAYNHMNKAVYTQFRVDKMLRDAKQK